jgi:hypothetical protein
MSLHLRTGYPFRPRGDRSERQRRCRDPAIEVEGREEHLRSFVDTMVAEAPPAAIIEHLQIEDYPFR